MQTGLDRVVFIEAKIEPPEQAMLYSIHFLRFVAALAIAQHHIAVNLGSPIMTGAAGVDLFFIISGTVIGLSTKAGESPVRFGINRFIRVVPLYWIATAVIVITRFWAWGIVPSTMDTLHSVFLIPASDPNWAPIYYPGWSLSYELLFYCIFGLLLTFCADKKLTWIAMIVLASLATSTLSIPGMQMQMLLEFTFGLLVCQTIKQKFVLDRLTGGICIVLAVVLFVINYKISNFRALHWGMPSLLLVFGMLSFEGARVFRHPLLILGGNASYAIYLTHVTVNTIAVKIEGMYVGGIGHRLLVFVLEMSASLIVGVAFHLAVERPLIAGLKAARDKTSRLWHTRQALAYR
jgi:exopolysaccharide production protein ExoZ